MEKNNILLTAGSSYLDVDAYACMVAMAELLCLRGQSAAAYSKAPCNYSVTESLSSASPIIRELPEQVKLEASYIIVDVSDPDFLKDSVPLERVTEVYDHHVGFEEYWQRRIGDGAHIEFIGAAATLIYREWKREGLTAKMSNSTARLLMAAILDNTLDFTSGNTTAEDEETYRELCAIAGVGEEFRGEYFSEVQLRVEADLRRAILNDTKRIGDNEVLPPRVAQLSVWNAQGILERLPEIRRWLAGDEEFLINLIDIRHRCSYFVCDCGICQENIQRVFDVRFDSGVARSPIPYLRKEIIKKTISKN